MFDAPRLPSTLPYTQLVDSPDAARLWLPRLSLANCARCVIMRNTLGLQGPRAEQARYSYYPASPSCAITWIFEGGVEELEPGPRGIGTGPCRPVQGRILLSGPYNRPIAVRYPEPIHAMMLLFMPDAFTAMTGVDPSAFLNQTVEAHTVLDGDWMALCEAVMAASDHEQRVALIEQQMAVWWQATRPSPPLRSHLLDDWYPGLIMRAANSGLGRSARQIERRVKQWTGQPLRELRGITRSERAFFQTIMAQEQGQLNWAELASNTGFTDQSHLCRQTRRLTGFAPEELRRRIAEDESFWPYRLWGFSGARPGKQTGP